MNKTLSVALAVLAPPAVALTALADAPAPVIDNGRVTVRDIMLQPGEPGPPSPMPATMCSFISMADASAVLTARPCDHAAGSAMAGHGGATSDTALDARRP